MNRVQFLILSFLTLAPALALPCVGIESVFKVDLSRQSSEGIVVQLNWQEMVFGSASGKKSSLEVLDDDGFLSYYLAYVKLRSQDGSDVRISKKDRPVLDSMLKNANHLKSYITSHSEVLNNSAETKAIRQKILGAIDQLDQVAQVPGTTLRQIDDISKDLRYYAAYAAYKTRIKGAKSWDPQKPFTKLELPLINETKDTSCSSSISVFNDSTENENLDRGIASDSN